MCGGGGKGTGGYNPMGGQWGNLTPQQQVTTQASPEAIGWYQQAMAKAQQAAATPWQNYSTDPAAFVAQLNAQQQAAQQGLAGQAAATAPFAQMGAGMQAAAGMGNAAQMAGSYMNPFMQQVVSPVQQALQQQQGQQLAGQQAEAIRSGAFGGERAGLQRQALRGQQQLGMGQALSPLYQTGYGQALQAAQTDLARQLQAGQGLSQAGLQAQQASLGAGTLGQQTQQAGLSALYNQWQQARMYPYQQAQFLAGIAGGLGPLMGQQSYQSQATNPFGMFLARGGVAENRMGGAVTESGDYARGGYARGGMEEDPLAIQEQMYRDIEKPVETSLPTGQIQAARSLEPAQFAPKQEQKSTLDSIGKIAGLAKEGISGLGSAYDWLKSSNAGKYAGVNPFPSSYAAPAAAAAEGTGILGGIGSALSGLGSSVMSGLESLGPAALAIFAKDGGRIGYQEGGSPENDDIFGRGILGAESNYRQFDKYGKPLRSSKGATGIAQVLPSTAPEAAKLAGVEYDPVRFEQDEKYNAALGRAYYNEQLRRFGDEEKAIAAYNAGPGRVQQAIAKAEKLGGDYTDYLPAETRAYLPTVMRKAGADQEGIGAALARMTPEQRSFLALDQSERGGVSPKEDTIFTEENVLPAISGLGAALEGMVTSPTVGIGGALLRGAGAGMKEGVRSALEVPKVRAETAKIGEEAKVQAQEALKRAAEVGKVGAETNVLTAGLYEKQWVPNVGWMVYDKSNPLKTPTRISDAEGNPISGVVNPEKVQTRPGGEKPVEPKKEVSATEWQPTLRAPEGTKIPGALNIAMSGDLPKQQEAAKQYIEQQRTKTDSANAQLYRLDEMERQFKSLPKEGFLAPGAYANERKEAANRINTLTSVLGGKPLFDPDDVAAAETLSKDTTRLGFDVSKSLGHEPGFIVQSATKANPGMENTPMAFNRITAGLKEAAHYEQDKLAFFEDYAARFGTLTGAEKLFRELNPPSAYANRAILSTIAPEHLAYMKSLTKKQLASGRNEIDKTYGAGVTDLLLGGK